MAATAFILGAVAATGGFAVLAGGSALAGILWDGRGRYGRGRYQYKDYRGYGEEKDEEKKKKEEEEEKKRRKKKDKERKQGKGPGGFSLRHDRSVPEGDADGNASAAEEQLLQGLRREDGAWCGLKLLCELAATAEASAEDLGEGELALLNLIGPVAKPGEGLLSPGGALEESQATGQSGLRKGACAEAFQLCPLDTKGILSDGTGFLP
ncbi:uncharacterized protein LOC134780304 [Penaeus indicus]|uniref:uncharacterized protein LOC134780304 n=1 Tax=Penaeus indicus TaxID=29960 RepID=UPI00300CF2D5